MESCGTVVLDPAAFLGARKLYEHAKAHLKKAVVQITDLRAGPVLSFMAKAGEAGIVSFRLANAVRAANVGPEVPSTLAFRNHSYGNTYVHSREMFGSNIRETSICMYRRLSMGHQQPEFVETKIVYTNDVTETRHTSTVDPHVTPVEKYLHRSTVKANVILSIKTCTALQKWLRQRKPELQSVRLHVNETLSVLVVTVGDDCQTIEFRGLEVEPADAFLHLDKPDNLGAVLSDCSSVVSLQSLIQAIGICKVPSVCVPAFKFYSGNVVEVTGTHLKQSKNRGASISVVLLHTGDGSDSEPGTPPPSTPCESASPAFPVSPAPHCSSDDSAIFSGSARAESASPGGGGGEADPRKRKALPRVVLGAKRPKKSKQNFASVI